MKPIHLIGVPLDLGAGRRGVDMGPSAVRIAGIGEQISALGYSIKDKGDLLTPLPELRDEQDQKKKYIDDIASVCTRLHDTSLESFGFFACAADLEDELIAALGAESVERVIEAQSELPSLRRFQAMPQHRGTPVRQQLRRFLGTRATRKIRTAPRLVEALTVAQLPRPLAGLAAALLAAASGAA